MRNFIRKFVGIGFIVVAIICAYLAWQQWKGYQDSIDYYQEMTEKNVKKKDGPWLELDWDSLSAQGIIGWIYACDGKISYPICYKENDNNFFLHRTPDGEYSYPGSIFMNGYCEPDFSGKHTILYGHNMRNGTMFQALHKYENDGYYDNHKNFYIFTPNGRYMYKIYSRHVVQDASDLYRLDFESNEDFGTWLETWQKTANESFGSQPDSSMQIMSLSTCTLHGSKRLVIQGYQKNFKKYPKNE